MEGDIQAEIFSDGDVQFTTDGEDGVNFYTGHIQKNGQVNVSGSATAGSLETGYAAQDTVTVAFTGQFTKQVTLYSGLGTWSTSLSTNGTWALQEQSQQFIAPVDGEWAGVSSQGQFVLFNVAHNGSYVNQFCYDFVVDASIGSACIAGDPGFPLDNSNQFFATSPTWGSVVGDFIHTDESIGSFYNYDYSVTATYDAYLWTCVHDSDCNDGVDCTNDTCTGGICKNTPNSALCAVDEQCVFFMGCR